MATRSDVTARLRPVPFREALEWAENRKVVPSDIYYGELQGFARMKAFSVAGLSSVSQLRQVLDSLNAVMRSGGSMAEWKKMVRDGKVPLALPNHRLDTIFRTNVLGSYARGRAQQHEETKDALPFLMYSAIDDDRVRPTHKALDRHIARYEDPFWRTHTPPLGYNCRCKLIQLTESQARARGWNPEAETPAPDVEADPGWNYDKREGLKELVDPGIAQAITRAVSAAPAAVAAEIPQKVTPAAGTPMGERIGDDWEIPKGKWGEPFREALRLVNETNGDGKLVDVKLVANEMERAFGRYTGKPTIGGVVIPKTSRHYRASEVQLSKYLARTEYAHPELTLAHEIGHLLDFEGTGKMMQSSATFDKAFESFRQAVNASPEILELKRRRAATSPFSKARETIDYYLSTDEMFARAYSQYVGKKTGNEAIKKAVEMIKASDRGNWSLSQWSDESFEPIERALDEAFRKIGWRS